MKPILIKTELLAPSGLTLICLHHEFTTAPFMEVSVEAFTLRHHMMYDHDVLEGEFRSPVLNDLTMWPRTQDPAVFRAAAEAVQRRATPRDYCGEAADSY